MIYPNHELREQIENKVLECLCKAEDVFRNNQFPMIPIEYDLKGKTAGQFCTRMGKMFIRVNMILLNENKEEYIKEVIPHEVAHYVVRVVYGTLEYRMYHKPVKSHGKEWKAVMERVFGLESNRCHSFDVSNSRRRMRRHVWNCGCREHKLSTRKHNNMLRRLGMSRFPIGYVLNHVIGCKVCNSYEFTYKGSKVI